MPLRQFYCHKETNEPSLAKMSVSGELSRTEVQRELKRAKILATGTTKALRERYLRYIEGKVDASDLTAAAKTEREEKRLKQYRSSCPFGTRQRIDRALTQRLYLIEAKPTENCDSLDASTTFAVLGSTGNVYSVKISRRASCSCPDYVRSYLCKHILFVLLKVLRVDDASPVIYQNAWLSTEVKELMTGWTERQNGILANDRVRERYAELSTNPNDEKEDEDGAVKRKSVEEEPDCAICFDPLGKEELTYCKVACGTNFHKACIERWATSGYHGLTCPNCRSPWQDASGRKKKRDCDEGYVNLGDLQGQSDRREYRRWRDY